MKPKKTFCSRKTLWLDTSQASRSCREPGVMLTVLKHLTPWWQTKEPNWSLCPRTNSWHGFTLSCLRGPILISGQLKNRVSTAKSSESHNWKKPFLPKPEEVPNAFESYLLLSLGKPAPKTGWGSQRKGGTADDNSMFSSNSHTTGWIRG